MRPKKENARGRAGAKVTGRQAKATNQKVQGKSTIGAPKRKMIGSEAQRKKVLILLHQGAKTTIDFRTHGIMMPATRIFELKQAGYNIQTELVPLFDAHGFRHLKCARYRLILETTSGETA